MDKDVPINYLDDSQNAAISDKNQENQMAILNALMDQITLTDTGQMKTCAGTSIIKTSPIHQCARMETGQGNESHSASASLNNLNPSHLDESVEFRRSDGTASFVNVTPPEDMKKVLDNIFDHPCGKCQSERVSHMQNNVWICDSCGELWGYDDSTDVDELVKEMFQFFPCPFCGNANMYEISFMYIDGTLQFGCHVCGYSYKPKVNSSRKDRRQPTAGLTEGNLGVLVGQAVQAYISGSGRSMK